MGRVRETFVAAEKLKLLHILSVCVCKLTFSIPSLARQRCLPSWGPRRTPHGFFVISQLFDAVDYSNYVFLAF